MAIVAGAVAAIGMLTPAASDSTNASRTGFAIISCSGGAPCEEGKNTSSGPGLEGISSKGSGVVGQTYFKSTSPSNGRAAVLGQDLSTSGFYDVGVMGKSPNGTGVEGTSTIGAGVVGTSSGGIGVSAAATTGYGIYSTTASGSYSIYSTTPSGWALYAVSGTGPGVWGISGGNVGVYANGGGVVGGTLIPALSVEGNAVNPDLIYACAYGGSGICETGGSLPAPQFAAINNGNVFITGQIFTAGSCSSGCASTHESGEKRVRFSTPQETLPTVEDFGEAQMIGGQSHVRIDLAFANTVDWSQPYMVFITPEGDSNGVFVTDKTTSGFDVRENRGGRSTLAFSYRIVARPFGLHARRLQTIMVTRPGKAVPSSRFPQ